MSKLIALFIVIAFVFAPLRAEASPYAINLNPREASKGRVAPMKKGDKAPFAGTLFDVDATAQMLVDKENAKAQCEIEKNEALDKQQALHDLETANLRAAKEAAERREKELVALKTDQVNFLSTQLEHATAKPKRNWGPLWFAGGVLGGILITIAAGYALGQVGTR